MNCFARKNALWLREMDGNSVEEIYGIRSSGKYDGLKPLYHEMYQLYADKQVIIYGRLAVCRLKKLFMVSPKM